MKTRYLLAGVVALAAINVACAKEPAAEIESARNAMQALVAAEAETYAPQALSEAKDTQALLDAELRTQADKFALLRSYAKTKELAASAESTAKRAASQAASAKEQARAEASAMLAELRTSVEEIKTLLAEAPTGKGTREDLMALNADLGQVEIALGEADSAFAAGKYRDATAKLEAARLSGQRIKSDIVAAIEARKVAKARRG